MAQKLILVILYQTKNYFLKYKTTSVYNTSYKTPTGPKPLRIRFDKINGFIVALNGTNKYLAFS